jgi:RNA polymerase sigma-32 factor
MDYQAEPFVPTDATESAAPSVPAARRPAAADPYAYQIRALPMLTEQAERHLIEAWYQRGDRAAFDRLIASHLRLVPRIAQKYAGYGIPVGDLIGEGNLGLLQSAVRFDPSRGFRFSTYARWWIKAAILNHILQSWSMIKIGNGSAKKRMFFNLRRAKARIGMDGERHLSEADIAALAARFHVSRADVIAMDQRLSAPDISLHQPVRGAEDLTIGDTLPSDHPTPEEVLLEGDEARHRRDQIGTALLKLERREREVVTQRYLSDQPKTLAALAVTYGVTAERVRQIEARAIAKLRHHLQKRTAGESALDAPPQLTRRPRPRQVSARRAPAHAQRARPERTPTV